MIIPRWFLTLIGLLSVSLVGFAKEDLVRRSFMVEGVKREALVSIPTKKSQEPMPVVFVYHGHGGSMQAAAQSFGIHRLWQDAMVVYPQGLPTPGVLSDPEGKKSGWQMSAGAQGDRDLKFFDAMFGALRKEFSVDEKRIYCLGHSNGGSFTYLLLGERGKVFAAVAPSAAVSRPGNQAPFAPRPVLHIAGRNDPLVKFSWQKLMIENLQRDRKCGPGEAKPGGVMFYPAASGASVSTYIHDGTHTFPAAAPQLMVDFFKANPLP